MFTHLQILQHIPLFRIDVYEKWAKNFQMLKFLFQNFKDAHLKTLDILVFDTNKFRAYWLLGYRVFCKLLSSKEEVKSGLVLKPWPQLKDLRSCPQIRHCN